MKKEQLQQLDTTELEVIEITRGMNGYPEGLGHFGLIGFENFEAAKKFASENDLDVVCFHKKDGWKLWEYEGAAYEPFENSDYLSKMGDDCNFHTDSDFDWYKDQLVELVQDCEGDFTAIEEKIQDIKKILEEVEKAGNDFEVIVANGKFIDTIEKEFMSYYFDTHYYSIGVY